jgi:uncharacterized membrane protein
MSEQLPAPVWPGIPKNSSEYITLIAHYYRAEMARMSGWRDRIDRTTNWAITVAGAMLSVSLSTPTAHHGVLLFSMVLVLLFLVIESRRYRFFDVYRARVRLLERQYFARVFALDGERDTDWIRTLSNDLQKPVFLMGHWLAFSRRLRRNYIWMFLIVLIAWLLKISTPKLMPDGIILLIGIVKKNGIMLIDFALEAERERGLSSEEAIHEACRLRFRPILMTPLCALLAGVPLMLGTGTGSEIRQPLGYAMVGGLLVSQVLTLFTTPIVYIYMDRILRERMPERPPAPDRVESQTSLDCWRDATPEFIWLKKLADPGNGAWDRQLAEFAGQCVVQRAARIKVSRKDWQ